MIDTHATAEAALRKRIGWICQATRFTAATYAVWLLFALTRFWTSVPTVAGHFGRIFEKDLSSIEPWQQAAGFGLQFGIWLFAAYACYSAWRLFTLYLNGGVFTADATLWLRRVAFFGALAQGLEIVTRPLMSILLTLHFPVGQKLRLISVYLQPNDLAFLMLLFGLLALAHIQRTATEIVNDHAQIV
jgi:hypothetical protein